MPGQATRHASSLQHERPTMPKNSRAIGRMAPQTAWCNLFERQVTVELQEPVVATPVVRKTTIQPSRCCEVTGPDAFNARALYMSDLRFRWSSFGRFSFSRWQQAFG